MESRLCLDTHRIPEKGITDRNLLRNQSVLKIKCLKINETIEMFEKFIVRKLYLCTNKQLILMRLKIRKIPCRFIDDQTIEYSVIKRSSENSLKGKTEFDKLIMMKSGDIERNPGPEGLRITSQNCRGLKNKEKLKQLLHRIQIDKKSMSKIVGLQETHLDNSNVKYSWPGNIAITLSEGSKGGVITLLSDNIKILEQIDVDCEGHILLVEVLENKHSQLLIIANIHSPCAHDQEKLNYFNRIYKSICHLMQINDNCEIVIIGDFNTTFWPSERINTTRSNRESKIADEITELFKDLNMVDCWDKYENTMTWRHGEKMSRIDRIQWSKGLELHLQRRKTEAYWTMTLSDHAAVTVELSTRDSETKRSIITRIDTSFLNNINLRMSFLKEIDEKMLQLGETSLDPHGKLEFLKMVIRSTAIEIATNYKKKMNEEYKDIEIGIKFWQSTFENASNEQYRNMAMENLDILIARRDKYLNERGKYLSDRSKTKWYQEGERGTKYFLNLNKAKCNNNEMSNLLINGNLTDNRESINEYVEQFYTRLYEKGDKSKRYEKDIDHFLRNLSVVSDVKINALNLPITEGELRETLQSCSDSSPGPDGIPYSIIKLTWKHFGKALLSSWEFAKINGSLAPSHETSYLRLLPKEGKNINELKNWRPITLSNCDFKIITKTLSWRLSRSVDTIISQNQTAYLKNRQISDNLNVMLYTLEKSEEAESMLVSLDAEKAFDSVEHWYIRKVLEKIGLTEFVKIFDVLYRNQNVNILLNGNQAGKYNIKNGVKQGDALSCILFILSVEPLLQNMNKDDMINGIKINVARVKPHVR